MGSKLLRGGGGFAVKKFCTHTYDNIISIENLLTAWQEFVRGKRKKVDVQEFQFNLMQNIIALHHDLKQKTYKHGGYKHFKIADPKPRDIHKASVRDRLLHHAIYRVLCPYFDTTFISASYSCRNGKGIHKAMAEFKKFAVKVSKNHTKTCYVLKCDIRKFFVSIDHSIMMSILDKHIEDRNVLFLLHEVINSFSSTESGKGLPLGNLTSQLLVNIYMNEFDQYVKQTLKVKCYIRYADDFVVLSHNRVELAQNLQSIGVFLKSELLLELHPLKVFISTFASGVDFLGWVHFLTHRVLRTSSKRRMLRRLVEVNYQELVVSSYLGMLQWGNTKKLQDKIDSYAILKL